MMSFKNEKFDEKYSKIKILVLNGQISSHFSDLLP